MTEGGRYLTVIVVQHATKAGQKLHPVNQLPATGDRRDQDTNLGKRG